MRDSLHSPSSWAPASIMDLLQLPTVLVAEYFTTKIKFGEVLCSCLETSKLDLYF